MDLAKAVDDESVKGFYGIGPCLIYIQTGMEWVVVQFIHAHWINEHTGAFRFYVAPINDFYQNDSMLLDKSAVITLPPRCILTLHTFNQMRRAVTGRELTQLSS